MSSRFVNTKVKSIQLWSDWNSDLLRWERRQSSRGGENFDFLVVRIEDLIDSKTRFQQIQRIADFVGSEASFAQLCCLAQAGLIDQGSHGSLRNNVKDRYGKWRDALDKDLMLSKELHDEGRVGLETFGYEPYSDWMDVKEEGGTGGNGLPIPPICNGLNVGCRA